MMHCNEIQARISASIDQELIESEDLLVKKHLEQCRGCSNLYRDLSQLRQSAGELVLHEPPPLVWQALRTQLLDEGLIQPSHQPGLWRRLFPLGLSTSFKPALAGAFASLILVALTYFIWNGPVKEVDRPTVSSDALVLGEVQKAESHYQKAIEALSEASQRKLDSVDPALAQIFNDNLATMDYYLKECKEAVQTNPDNPLIQRYLLTAYQKKVELLQTIVNSDSL